VAEELLHRLQDVANLAALREYGQAQAVMVEVFELHAPQRALPQPVVERGEDRVSLVGADGRSI
jgi:hypothetical protein